MSVVVREARHEDADALARLVLALNAHQEDKPARLFSPDVARRDATGPARRVACVVAEEGGRLVGYVTAMPAYESNWAAAGSYVADLWVAPDRRRKGIARRLLAAIAARAQREGGSYLWWASRPWNGDAHAFYARLGATSEDFKAHALVFDAFETLADEGARDLPPAVEIATGWRPGVLGAVVALHASYYARHWEFGPRFESRVARGLADFLDRHDPAHDLLLVALRGEQIAGSLVIDGGEPVAIEQGAHLRWFILDDRARGAGIGGQMMTAAMAFLRATGFRRCYLDTFAGLDAARRLYERHGFRLDHEAEAESWGTHAREQRFVWRA